MTHADKGNYAGKHPAAPLNASVGRAVRDAAHDGVISCADAHTIGRECKLSPDEIGRAIDAAEVRIAQCQLGIFKHSREMPAASAKLELNPELEQALTILQVNGRLTCEAAWSVAERFSLGRLQIGAACDSLGIKISSCQLGTFR